MTDIPENIPMNIITGTNVEIKTLTDLKTEIDKIIDECKQRNIYTDDCSVSLIVDYQHSADLKHILLDIPDGSSVKPSIIFGVYMKKSSIMNGERNE